MKIYNYGSTKCIKYYFILILENCNRIARCIVAIKGYENFIIGKFL